MCACTRGLSTSSNHPAVRVTVCNGQSPACAREPRRQWQTVPRTPRTRTPCAAAAAAAAAAAGASARRVPHRDAAHHERVAPRVRARPRLPPARGQARGEPDPMWVADLPRERKSFQARPRNHFDHTLITF